MPEDAPRPAQAAIRTYRSTSYQRPRCTPDLRHDAHNFSHLAGLAPKVPRRGRNCGHLEMAEPLISTLRLVVIFSRRIGSAKVQGHRHFQVSRAISADIERRTGRITGIHHAVRCPPKRLRLNDEKSAPA